MSLGRMRHPHGCWGLNMSQRHYGYAVDVWMDVAAIQIFSRLSIEPLPELKTDLLSSGF